MFSITENNSGMEALQKRLAELLHTQLQVGFFDGEAHSESGVPLAEIAKDNTEGTTTIPARPFMQETVAMSWVNKDALSKLGNVLDTKTPVEATMNDVGAKTKNVMEWNIINGAWIGNAPATIHIKGFDKPLQEYGEMLDGIKWRTKKNVSALLP